MNFMKGFNKAVIISKDKVKRTRVLTEETKMRKVQGVLDQIEDGRVLISTESQKYKSFLAYPDQLVDRCLQALKYGASVEEIRIAGEKTFSALKGKLALSRQKSAIYEFAKSKGLEDRLTEVAELFELEEPGTIVVASEPENETVAAE